MKIWRAMPPPNDQVYRRIGAGPAWLGVCPDGEVMGVPGLRIRWVRLMTEIGLAECLVADEVPEGLWELEGFEAKERRVE